MVVGIKDGAKLAGISIIACCAVLVCTMFLNFSMDMEGIRDGILTEQAMSFYEAQLSSSHVVCLVSGGCLLLTSAIMLLFYIKHYIDTHKKELGILKALGYSNFKIAKNFWVFGISVFTGAGAGFAGAFLIMPSFYQMQNEDQILPEISLNFHWVLLLYLVVLPAAVFAILSICYACRKLKMPALALLKESLPALSKARGYRGGSNPDSPFIDELKRATLRSRKALVFFIGFASFCFSSMTQMSFGMKELASAMMGVMILLIGILLACTTLFLAITTVINANRKTIAMMRVFGYSHKDCRRALLGGYRPVSYVGFAIGTVYQYALIKIMVDVVFKDIADVPEYEFDFPVMLLSLAVFLVLYELVMHYYSEKIKKVPVKEIMLE